MPITRRNLLTALAGLPLAACVPTPRQGIDYELSRLAYRWDVPGVAYAIMDQGAISQTAAFGWLNRWWGTAADTSSLFQAGLLSQVATTALALRLVAVGRLSLDGDIRDDLGGWSWPRGVLAAAGGAITLRRLLAGTAGLSSGPDPYIDRGQAVPDTLDLLQGVQPIAAPGEQAGFSVGGYTVVQRAIEVATERPFAAAAAQWLNAPFATPDLIYAADLPPDLRARAALGHSVANEGADSHWWDRAAFGDSIEAGTPVGGWFQRPALAGDGLWASALGLGALLAGLARSFGDIPGAPLPPDLARAMVQPVDGLDHGLGGKIGRAANGATVYWRADRSGGYRNLLIWLPQSGQGVVLLTNSERGDTLGPGFLDQVTAAYGWPGLPDLDTDA